MIGLDTNVLVRYITQDDPVQTKQAVRLMESLDEDTPGYITLIALAETIWVLEESYNATRIEIAQTVERLLTSRELRIEQTELVRESLKRFQSSKADFADSLIERSGHAAGCKYTATFDKKASKMEGMTLIS